MSHTKDRGGRNVKRAATKTAKEKRAAKREKKAERSHAPLLREH